MSWLRTIIASGVPSVRPSCMPDRISTWSASRRWVVIALWPGRRRSSSRWISSTPSGRRGGQPSMTTPTAAPCDSPKVVMRNALPKLFPGMPAEYLKKVAAPPRCARERLAPRQHVDHAAVNGFARQHEHATAALLDLQEQITRRAVAPDVRAAGGAFRDAPRDLDGRAPGQPLHVHEVV